MAASNGSNGSYEVHSSGIINRLLRALQEQASLEDRGEEFLVAIRKIWHRLRHDPSTFGEPLYRLPGLRMQVRTAVVLPLAIDFGVCEDRPLVFIKGVKLL